MKRRKPRIESHRRQRERPTPKWLKTEDLDEMARRRCLMILSVLSGVTPVSQAVEEAKISRGTYYQMETRAIRAMLEAMVPGSEARGGGEGTSERLAAMEKQLTQLQKEKRRAERLAFLTKQLVRPGPMTSGKGPRPTRKPRASKKSGRKPSAVSTTPKETKGATSPSPPTPAGTGEL